MHETDETLDNVIAELNLGIGASTASSEDGRKSTRNTAELDKLLKLACSNQASDLLVIAGAPPVLRINGSLVSYRCQFLMRKVRGTFFIPF
jgi:hypothetical protein